MSRYSKFFRKNIAMIASVIPDPGVDFPDAVALIEQGRFSTEGIFTHTMPLADVQRGFEIASECANGALFAAAALCASHLRDSCARVCVADLDEVVKLVIEL
eukprot:COSAG05_NODE_4403_length_1529_cov_1.497902_2_plen_102_part_00